MSVVPLHIVVMGVSGCGKSSVAKALAARLAWPFAEADEFHSAANVAKMQAGIPLADADRWPWLNELQAWMTWHAAAGRSTVMTCSALKVAYREILAAAEGQVLFVHLAGSQQVIAERMKARADHFMPTSLLDSQFATLEPLTADENGFTVPITGTVAESAQRILDQLQLP